ncbi:MAG: PD40 domain-containing protein [Planctomyces sp.]|nr:PD40 domain-containing protein [Planctomyces sp.]
MKFDSLPPVGRWLAAAFLALSVREATAQVTPHPGMMRFPDVSADRITFIYGEDVWVAPRTGGMATPLAGPPGEESLPRFSADGKTIAFVGNYEGNEDLYVIPSDGGVARRVTYHPSAELLCDWTADGRLVYSSDAFVGLGRQSQLFVRGPEEPQPKQLPVPYGTNGAISADGVWLAYTPHSHDYRTWKRYRGGMASDIWLFNLTTNESKQITDYAGTDSLPMWHGSIVYYLSDAGNENRLNIWSYNLQTTERRQLTSFANDDCKWPSIGPGPDGQGEIILQNGAALHLVALNTGAVTKVEITVPGDRPTLRPRTVDASAWIGNLSVSPNAKRVAVEARGDIWTVPAKNGSPRNLTRSSGIAERDPSWSPDGKSLAWFSDVSGEYELYVASADGLKEARQLTKDGKCFRYSPIWSPDSKWLYFCDKTGAMFLTSVESGETRQIDKDPTSGQIQISWSHNSEWVAYARPEDQRSPNNAIWLQNVLNGTKQKVTSGFFNDAAPSFDHKGDFLYFASHRAFNSPKYEDLGSTFIYTDTEVLVAMPLRNDVKQPMPAKSDEETSSETAGDKTETKPTEASTEQAKTEEPKEVAFKPLLIDLDGLEARSFQLPVPQGAFGSVAVNDKGHVIYVRRPSQGASAEHSSPSIKLFDPTDEKQAEKTVVDGNGNFAITPDGKKLLVVGGSRKMWIVDAAADQKLEQQVTTSGLNATIEPRAEWKQVLTEAWRIERDFFYDPNMHGVDWPAVRDHYTAMLDDCVSRRDVSFLIREMISELNVGHAYYREGDVEEAPRSSTGLLGCRLEMAEGAWRIGEIFRGAVWDVDARNPLDAAGIKTGEYLLAVNHVPLRADVDPYAAFQKLAGSTVVLTISTDPQLDDADRRVPFTMLASDADLRFRAWIEDRRKYVESRTEGRVGYIYVVNTGVPGQNDLVRQLYGQKNKEALIIDDRWNGGGQIPTRFIELLNRPVTNYWAVRDGRDWTWPMDSHQGPKCMLINGMAGSGGDMFPALFRQNKLGKLIGMRTWGGLVGISGNPNMIDGSSVTAPTFAYYENDGTWGIEGHGVDPDIQVIDDPAKMLKSGDPQLDSAIDLMLEELKTAAFKPPARPAYPDRKGAGIKPEDK